MYPRLLLVVVLTLLRFETNGRNPSDAHECKFEDGKLVITWIEFEEPQVVDAWNTEVKWSQCDNLPSGCLIDMNADTFFCSTWLRRITSLSRAATSSRFFCSTWLRRTVATCSAVARPSGIEDDV